MYKKDITGQQFGRLTALRPTDRRDAKGSVIWECQCTCGNLAFHSVNYLNRKGAQSCGCLFQQSRAKCPSFRRDMVEHTSLSQLAASKSTRRDNKSGCTGVSWNKTCRRWAAYITIRKKRWFLGSFCELDEAIRHRKAAERVLHDPLLLEHWGSLTESSKRKVSAALQADAGPNRSPA